MYDVNSDLVKVSVSYICFGAKFLWVCTSHICAHITLIRGFIGWWFSEVCEGEGESSAASCSGPMRQDY